MRLSITSLSISPKELIPSLMMSHEYRLPQGASQISMRQSFWSGPQQSNWHHTTTLKIHCVGSHGGNPTGSMSLKDGRRNTTRRLDSSLLVSTSLDLDIVLLIDCHSCWINHCDITCLIYALYAYSWWLIHPT